VFVEIESVRVMVEVDYGVGCDVGTCCHLEVLHRDESSAI
jgi:hypothetical protein